MKSIAGAALDPTRWSATDPSSAMTVISGKLQVAGGTGVDGQTTVAFAEKIELGGALVLQHGDIAFNAPSNGVLGGLYPGFDFDCRVPGRIPNHSERWTILHSGAGEWRDNGNNDQHGCGASLCTHHAILCHGNLPRAADFSFRRTSRGQRIRRSSCGGGFRVVLEVHQTDPANPATLIAASTVLYDGIIGNVSGFCTYGW